MNSVELIGTYGGDKSHAMSAWTSTTRTPSKMDRMPKLLDMLAKNGHHTPFEKSTLHFLCRVDTATHIHLLKHRIGVSINAESARYKELKEGTDYIPKDLDPVYSSLLRQHAAAGRQLYHKCIKYQVDQGMNRARAKEAARYFLGYTNQLTLDVSFNFRSFMHFQGLRNKEEAQDEVHEVARLMLDLVRDRGGFEHSLAAFGY